MQKIACASDSGTTVGSAEPRKNSTIWRESIVYMGWATHYIEKLRAGEAVSFRPRGSSMKGRIESGNLRTVVPVDCSAFLPGDIVLCKVRGAEYLHLVKAVRGEQFQIGNNRGGINGWVGPHSIFGKCIRVEP